MAEPSATLAKIASRSCQADTFADTFAIRTSPFTWFDSRRIAPAILEGTRPRGGRRGRGIVRILHAASKTGSLISGRLALGDAAETREEP